MIQILIKTCPELPPRKWYLITQQPTGKPIWRKIRERISSLLESSGKIKLIVYLNHVLVCWFHAISSTPTTVLCGANRRLASFDDLPCMCRTHETYLCSSSSGPRENRDARRTPQSVTSLSLWCKRKFIHIIVLLFTIFEGKKIYILNGEKATVLLLNSFIQHVESVFGACLSGIFAVESCSATEQQQIYER